MTTEILVTLDVDWAPDFVIDAVAERLRRHRVKATWFVTHACPALERLRECHDLFECGIHPNFLPGSSHGASIDAVLAECMRLVPDARTMRSHDLYQSTSVFKRVLSSTPIRRDVSLFLPGVQDPHPFEFCLGGRSLWRIPYSWEDDYEMLQSCPDWTLPRQLAGGGTRILDFHPIHVYLNSSSFIPYGKIKSTFSRLQDAAPDVVDRCVSDGPGTGTLFDSVIAHLGRTGGSRTIGEAMGDGVGMKVIGT